MNGNRLLPLLFAPVLAAPAFAQAGAGGGGGGTDTGIVHVGPSVHVSTDMPRDPHGEVEIDANPADARELLACSMVYPLDSPTSDVVTYTSSDSGKNWARTLVTKGGDDHLSWDPDCRFGQGQVAYALSEGRGPGYPDSYVRLDRSDDGGRHWEELSRSKHAERSFLVVNHHVSPETGGLYLYGIGDTPNTIRVGYSRDGGRTFASQVVSMGTGVHVVNVGAGVVLSDGTLAIPVPVYTPPPGPRAPNFRIQEPGFIRLVRVRVQRPNWPLNIDTSTVAPWFVDLEPNGSYYTTLAVDGSGGPFRDRLYAVWESRASGRSVVRLAFSSDGGKTWSRPRQIDDDAGRQAGETLSGPDDIHGIVTVNDSGVVGVSWLDRRDHADDLGWSLRFRASRDGGETFTPGVQASPVDYDPARGGRVPLFGDGDYALDVQSTNTLSIPWFDFHGGHTMGLAADAAGRFHPLWIANPAGTPQLWTTTIAVDGGAMVNGGPPLAGLQDASRLVRLEFLDRSYDLMTHALDFDLRLENAGKAAIRGPVKVRVLHTESYIGLVTTDGDGAHDAEGTVWDFTPLLPGSTFEPGAVTKPMRVHLVVRGVDPFSEIGQFTYFENAVATFTTKVLVGTIENGPRGRGR